MTEAYDVSHITIFDVENEMAELGRELDNAPDIIKEFHNSVRAARKAYKLAYALAYSRAEGTQVDRKMLAEINTQEQLDALDTAEVEYRYVRDELDAKKTKLRALQSVGSMIKAQMFLPQGGSQ